MDTRSVAGRTVPAGLPEQIAADYPSFLQEWMDDRTRTLAVVWLLQHMKPDLLLVHLVDLDSEQHDNAPFTREAKAVLEWTDELIGQVIRALPAGSALALVSDHGFERVDMMVNLESAAAKQGVTNLVQSGGFVIAPDERAAQAVRMLAVDKRYGIGRQIPKEELAKFPSGIPSNAAAVFEAADGFMFAPRGPEFSKPSELGNHGHWPMRYRAVYVLWGTAIAPAKLPEFSMRELAGRFARVIDIRFP